MDILFSAIIVVTIVVCIFLIIRKFIHNTLRSKLILTFLAVALIPLSVLAFLNNIAAQVQLVDSANQVLLAAASQTATNLDTFIETTRDTVRTEAHLPVLAKYLELPADQRAGSPLEAEAKVTLRFLSRKNHVSSYALLDHEGRTVLDTVASDIGLNRSDREYFRRSFGAGQVYYSRVEFSPETGKASLYFSSPVHGTAGDVIGVLRVRYDAAVLQELVAQNNGLAGPDSFAILFDENHIYQAHGTVPETLYKVVAPLDPTQLTELQVARRLPPDLPTEELLLNLADLEQNLVNATSQPFFTARDVTTDDKLEQVAVTSMRTQPWLVAFFQPREVFLAPIDAQTRVTVLATMAIITVVTVSAVWVSRRLARPIIDLTAVAQQVAEGNLEVQVTVSSQDETGQLGKVFNSMTSQLRELVDSLEQRVADRTHRLEIVATLGERLNAILDPNDLLREVVNQVKQNFGYYHTHIYLFDDSGKNLIMAASAGQETSASDHRIPLDSAKNLVAHAARSGEIVMANNLQVIEDWTPDPLFPDTLAEVAVPIIQKGEVIGVLDVQENKISGLDESDANLLRSLANQVAVALQTARLFEETTQSKEAAEIAKEKAEQARQEIEMANKALEIQVWQSTGQAQLSSKMRGEQDLGILANNIIRQLCHYLQVQIGALYLVEDHTLYLAGRYAYSSKKSSEQFKFGEGLVGQVAVEKQPMIIDNVPDNYITVRSGLGETGPKNIVLLPFVYNDQVMGVIELGTLTEFRPVQIEFIQTALDGIAIAFNTAQARARINELLTETQRQAEELQVQGEELRAINEELEVQTESLRASETKLREKQVELEATNTRLEEQATTLEESSRILREKQAILDKHNQELKMTQQELQKKAEELALASKYKSEFLANMSHELRTPLNSLLILARMLANNEEGNLTKDQIESAQIIYSGGKDLLNLINDILDLAKVEAGKMSFNIEAMPLTDLLTMTRLQFGHVAEEKGLDLKLSLADDLPASIETDPQRIKQVIKNLLSNAFKFTTVGSVSLNIGRPETDVRLSCSDLDPSQTVAISVADTGVGISLDQQKIIFEAFQQADGSSSRQYGGTGLGLSISRELATKLGGQIEVESKPGQGSTFTLYLPIGKKESEREEEAKAQMPQRALPQPSSRPTSQPDPQDDRAELKAGDKTLLIIEDDPKFVKILYDFAHKKAFKCLIAPDGSTGLTLVKTYEPEAIILDLHLPDISGWEVLQALKNEPATRHIPVHIISADNQILDAYHKGAMGYLTKPVSQVDLDESFHKIEQFMAREIKTLLLVEDDPHSRYSIKKLLGGNDIQISEAESGQMALDLLKTQHFDCVILDLALPDMTGFEVLNKMNGHEAVTRCPVIVYTGGELTPEENLELTKYADSVIVKGIKSPERLLDETALFLHRMVADMPEDKQQTIKQLYNKDSQLKGKKILIVDDDMRNSFALSKLLSDKGIIVKIAQNGQKALDLLAEELPDLVLMDIMMPVMDGYEATKHIRAQQRFKNLPILALTAKAMKGDQEKCLAAGANDYLAKPIDVDRLFSMLRVWLYQ